MRGRQPFDNPAQLLKTADNLWSELTPADWLEAFASHPRIGEKSEDQRAAKEQSGVAGAAQDTLARLAAGNREYEKKFGYIYIVCASGKTAGEMLDLLESRLGNDPDAEMRAAAEQQRQITRLRLEKFLGKA
jgi:OHCU decarboxylase